MHKQIAIAVILIGAGLALSINSHDIDPLIIFTLITAAVLLYMNWGRIPANLKQFSGELVAGLLIIYMIGLASFSLCLFFFPLAIGVAIWRFGPRIWSARQRRRAGSTP